MSLLTMQTSLRSKLGSPTVAEIADIKLTEWLNSAYQDIAVKYRFKNTRAICRFPTIANIFKYGLPSDTFSVLSVYDETNHQPIEKVGFKNLDEQGLIPNAKPLFYSTYKQYIELTPVPDAAYTIRVRYKLMVLPLVNPSDVTIIPTAWNDPIIFYARWWAWEELQQWEKSKHALNAYKLLIADIPDEMTEESSDFESGVQMPHLTGGQSQHLDFDHRDD